MMTKKVDFNEFSNSYNDIMSKQHAKFGNIEYYSQHKARLTKKVSKGDEKSILEFGCGIGRNLPSLQKEFPNAAFYGSDISIDSLVIANNNNPTVAFIDDVELNDYAKKFDLIFIAGVYHHIEPKLRDKVTKKVVSLLKPNGQLICFEHNPYNPLTRHMVNTCEFDKDAVLLTIKEVKKIFQKHSLELVKSGYTLFVPSKFKKLNFIEPFFAWLPLGGQHYVVFRKK